METNREDLLFEDPMAEVFLREAGWSPPAHDEAAGDGMRPFFGAIQAGLILRTAFLDDSATDAVAAGFKQVLVFGAGFDAPAYRLAWPRRVTVFELDRAGVIAFRERVLANFDMAPRCVRHPVVADLLDEWADRLVEAGYDERKPSAWLAEGVFVYFDRCRRRCRHPADERVVRTKQCLGLSLASKEWLDEASAVTQSSERLTATAALWRSAEPRDPVEWLGDHGWTAEVIDAEALSTSYGSATPRTNEGPMGWLVRAVRSVSQVLFLQK